MRSIGKKNIKLVERLTIQEIENIDYIRVRVNVIDKLPKELWDIWESADSEIRNIIDKTIMNR